MLRLCVTKKSYRCMRGQGVRASVLFQDEAVPFFRHAFHGNPNCKRASLEGTENLLPSYAHGNSNFQYKAGGKIAPDQARSLLTLI